MSVVDPTMRNRVAMTVGWLGLGALLGWVGGKLLWGEPVGMASSVSHADAGDGSALELRRQYAPTETLYTALPILDSEKWTQREIAEQLRGASRASSPERRRADLHRRLLAQAHDPLRVAEVAAAVAREADSSSGHRRLLGEIYKIWGRQDPMAALASLEKLEDHSLQFNAFRALAGAWAKTDPEAALSALGQSELALVSDEAAEVVLNALAKQDPESALSLARQLGEDSLVRQIESQAIVQRAQRDMDSVWRELSALEDAERQRDLRLAAIRGLAREDRREALRYAEKIEKGKERAFAVSDLFRDWPLSDAEEARQVFAAYPADQLPARLAFQFGQTMNLAGSDEALAYAAELEGEKRQDYLQGVLLEQAIKQPERTAEIVGDYLTDEADLAQVYEHLGSSWAGKDEHAAAAWLATLPESRARDEAVGAFSRKLFSMDPERAVQWASSISDAEERGQRLDELLRQWRNVDDSAAETWLGTQGGSPVEVE